MITITIMEKTKYDSDYKYLITRGAYSYCAFHTEKGFKSFLEIANINLDSVEPRTFESEENGKVNTYFLDTIIEEKSFWSHDELPKEAICFKGLCNGSYVDCYYQHTDNGSIIFRPNPNAKEIYNPLSLEEHLEFSRING